MSLLGSAGRLLALLLLVLLTISAARAAPLDSELGLDELLSSAESAVLPIQVSSAAFIGPDAAGMGPRDALHHYINVDCNL